MEVIVRCLIAGFLMIEFVSCKETGPIPHEEGDTLSVEGEVLLDEDFLLDYEPAADADVDGFSPAFRWEIREEDVPWERYGGLQYYQWGTAKIDTPGELHLHNDMLYLAGAVNFTLNGTTNADGCVKIIDTRTGKMKTYLFGNEEPDLTWGSSVARNGDLLVFGSTTGNFGTLWQGIEEHAFVMRINPTTDIFSVIQWGNDGACQARIGYEEEDGSIIVVGMTTGTFDNQTLHGKNDLFLARIENDEVYVLSQFGPQEVESEHPPVVIIQPKPAVHVTVSSPRVLVTDTHLFFSALVEHGALPGETYYGGDSDGAIIAVDRKTMEMEFYQVGTSQDDMIAGLVEGPDKNIYFVGATDGSFPNIPKQGEEDILFGYLDVMGQEVVILSTPGGQNNDQGNDVAFHDGKFYLVGPRYGSACESASLKTDGILMQLDDQADISRCVAVMNTAKTDNASSLIISQEGRVYIAGTTYGSLGSEFFGDDSSQSFDAVLFTATLDSLGFASK